MRRHIENKVEFTRSMKVTTASVSRAKSPSKTVVSGNRVKSDSLESCTSWRTCSSGKGGPLRSAWVHSGRTRLAFCAHNY